MDRNENKTTVEFFKDLTMEANRAEQELLTYTILKMIECEGRLTEDLLFNLIYNCQSVSCFHNGVIINELGKINIVKNTLKWFIHWDDIYKELTKVCEKRIILFSDLIYLAAIILHIQTKVMVSIIEDYGFVERYNNKDEFSILRKAQINFFKRREYQKRNYSTKLNSELEEKFNKVVDDMEETLADTDLAKKVLMELARGKSAIYLKHLDEFKVLNGTRSQGYLALFDLIKLIIRDEKFLTEEEYVNMDIYSKGYDAYKISKVKKYITA